MGFETMTKAPSRFRTRGSSFLRNHGAILAILVLAASLRLDGIGFGLPALNDPDEPLFMMLAIDMLHRGSLDPQWFGHPATTTLYCLALIIAGTGALGIATGRFPDIEAFAQAVYADPGIVILPARLFIAANGVLCVWLTYLIGKRLAGRTTGLVAALVLAINSVHITWSQVIRTDVQASVLMFACCLATIAMLRDDRRRLPAISGIWAGIACATKWPAALIVIAPLGAAGARALANRRYAWWPVIVGCAAIITLFVTSPYLLLSHDIVLSNLAGEARSVHPGATGHGFFGNQSWYLGQPLAGSLGWAGLAVAIAGTVFAAFASKEWRLVVAIPLLAFWLAISAQSLLWERWIVPVLPCLALGFGWAASNFSSLLAKRSGRVRWAATFSLAAVFFFPMVAENLDRSRERRHDTRQYATQWAREHVPTNATILVEHGAIDLLNGPWTILFPLGSAGCVNAREMLEGKLSASDAERRREGSPVVDLGHVPSSKLATCKADFAILTNYDRYRNEAQDFASENGRYDNFLASGYQSAASIAPQKGKTGGPKVHIFVRGTK